MVHATLCPEREAEAQQLLRTLREAVDEELLAMARALVATDEHSLFGDTEFQVRDLVHRLGSTAYQVFLAQKKTATAARP